MSTATASQVQSQVALLYGRWMDLVGMYGGVPDGTNPYLVGAVRDGLTRMGYAIADPAGLAVQDADLAAFDNRALRRLFEWAGIFLLEQVVRDWFRAEGNRPKGLEVRVVGGVKVDPLAAVKSQVTSEIAALRLEVLKPYQSMNVPVAVGQLDVGTRSDPTLPPGVLDLIPPLALAPDGLWPFGFRDRASRGLGPPGSFE